MQQRGFEYVSGNKNDYASNSYWWDRNGKDCVIVEVMNGRVVTINDAKAQELAAGESKVETFTISVTDNKGSTQTQNVVITITGTNDKPAITVITDVNGAITEITDGGTGEGTATLSDSGSFTFADVDLIDTHTISVTPGSAMGYFGTFTPTLVQGTKTINWNFSVPDADLDALRSIDVITQTYTVRISDGKGGQSTAMVKLIDP